MREISSPPKKKQQQQGKQAKPDDWGKARSTEVRTLKMFLDWYLLVSKNIPISKHFKEFATNMGWKVDK